jgi:glutamyl-tRNA synthetase
VDSLAPRLRFAPSPTGFFHVGGARTALFNWLLAQRTGGALVLRIEDTDTERNRDEWTQGIQDAMRWIGVDWTEGPYFQSQRSDLYAAAIEKLRAAGHTYYCSCVSADVEARNIAKYGKAEADRGYDGFCRERRLDAEGHATRFRTPDEGITIVRDLIRGEPEFENSRIEDFIIARSNGSAMFILANVVDDIDMRISHVIRGEEHLPNTPKAVLLWQALTTDVALPVFAHLPVIVNEQRKKLSKRRDKVAVEDYELMGVLPEAMRNFLVLLGWSLSNDREIVSVQTMIDEFRLEDVNKSPAFFDMAKLAAFNGEYLRALSTDDFVSKFEDWFHAIQSVRSPWSEFGQVEIAGSHLGEGRQEPPFLPWDPSRYDRDTFRRLVPIIQERAKLLSEVPALVEFAFVDSPPIDNDSWDKTMAPGKGAIEMLDGFLAGVDQIEFTHDALKSLAERVGEANGLKLGKAQAPLRVAVTGRTVGPPLFEALEVLGRERTIERMVVARAKL